jgi:hypothetical protein
MSLSKSAGASETAAQIGKLPLGRRIGDDGIDRDVQFVDNLLADNCSQATDAVPHMGLAARQEVARKNPARMAY